MEMGDATGAAVIHLKSSMLTTISFEGKEPIYFWHEKNRDQEVNGGVNEKRV
jgi:hypothetical protein